MHRLMWDMARTLVFSLLRSLDLFLSADANLVLVLSLPAYLLTMYAWDIPQHIVTAADVQGLRFSVLSLRISNGP